MTAIRFALPETVDLLAAKKLAEDLLQHISLSPAPLVTTTGLRQGGVPLLQTLVAARVFAASLGKTFTVEAQAEGALARLLAACGLDPVLCGAPADLVPSPTAASFQRT